MKCETDINDLDKEAQAPPKCTGTLVDEVTPPLGMDCETDISELDEAEVPPGVDEVTPALGMDCEAHIHELDEGQVPPPNGPSILVDEVTPALEPKTPVSNRETGESLYDVKSPLTSVKDLAKVPCVSAASSTRRIVDFFCPVAEISPPPQTPSDPVAASDPVAQRSPQCKTPESAVYDSFAPAPDGMCLAPLAKKCGEDLKFIAVYESFFPNPDGMLKKRGKDVKFITPRRLSFDSDEEDEVGKAKESPNKEISKFVSRAVSQILSDQVQGSLDQDQVAHVNDDNDDNSDYDNDSDGYTTPTTPTTPPSRRTLTGVGETCPSAPSRPVNRRKNIDLESCRDEGLVRRLDFDSD